MYVRTRVYLHLAPYDRTGNMAIKPDLMSTVRVCTRVRTRTRYVHVEYMYVRTYVFTVLEYHGTWAPTCEHLGGLGGLVGAWGDCMIDA